MIAETTARRDVSHDYTHQHWGHSFEPLGLENTYAGHGPATGPKILVGDWILSRMRSGRVGRLLVTQIRYMQNPSDQWFATLELDGYVP